MRKKGELLEDVSDIPLFDRQVASGGRVEQQLIADGDLALIGPREAGEASEDGCFPGSRRAEDHRDAGLSREAHVQPEGR